MVRAALATGVLVGFAVSADAQFVADFEAEREGRYGRVIESGGITFSEPDDRLRAMGSHIWAIDDAADVWLYEPLMQEFVDGKALNVNELTPGANGYWFPRVASLEITTGRIETEAALSVIYTVDRQGLYYGPNTITLQAFLAGQVVAEESIQTNLVLGGLAGVFSYGADRLAITGVEFDTLRLLGRGPVDDGAWYGGIDNVVVGACYADCDTSTGRQVLDVFDFLCFQDAFVAGEGRADCDGSGRLDIFDFLCFQDAFASGCP